MSNNLITLSAGAAMTGTFRAQKENILAQPYKNSGKLPTCETFARSAFDSLLALGNVTGIRIYSSMDVNLNVRMIVVGVNSNNEDVYIQPDPESGTLYVIENGVRCPDNCPPASALNS